MLMSHETGPSGKQDPVSCQLNQVLGEEAVSGRSLIELLEAERRARTEDIRLFGAEQEKWRKQIESMVVEIADERMANRNYRDGLKRMMKQCRDSNEPTAVSLRIEISELLGRPLSDPDAPTIADLAVRYCEAHREDYDVMKTSDSMDVDVDFILLCEAVWPATTPAGKETNDDVKNA